MVDQTVLARLAMIAVLLGYLVIITVTHFSALPLVLEAPLAFIGWLFLPVLYVWAKLRRIDTNPRPRPSVREFLRPLALTVTFAALAGVAVFLAIDWDAPSFCQGPVPVNCVKAYQWSTDNGHYYHTTPDGTHAEISPQEYVQEVGFDLRSAATFGVFAMCLAWLAAAVLRSPSRSPH